MRFEPRESGAPGWVVHGACKPTLDPSITGCCSRFVSYTPDSVKSRVLCQYLVNVGVIELCLGHNQHRMGTPCADLVDPANLAHWIFRIPFCFNINRPSDVETARIAVIVLR